MTNDTTLRPSIETLIHALMPQRIVIHLHAIDVLSHLVRDDCDVILKKCFQRILVLCWLITVSRALILLEMYTIKFNLMM